MSAIVTDSINAFIKIYGSGSKMDTSSPYYQNYVAGDVYNRNRALFGNMVAYRPARPYKDYDWEHDSFNTVTKEGSGRRGVIHSWPETEPNPKLMQDVLDRYCENFKLIFAEEFVPWAEQQMGDVRF